MQKLFVTVQVMLALAGRKLTAESERGSETMEKVLWAAAAIVIAGVVVTAVTTFVTNGAATLRWGG